MLTKIEIEYMEAIKTIAREMRKDNADQPNKEPDWEQRRYEVAKELFPILAQIKQSGTGIRTFSDVRELARAAVDGADVLVEELRAPYNNRDYGKKGK